MACFLRQVNFGYGSFDSSLVHQVVHAQCITSQRSESCCNSCRATNKSKRKSGLHCSALRQTGHQFFDGHCCRTKLSCPKTCKPLQSLRILCDRLPSAIAWMPIQFAWARFHAMRPVRAFANWSPEDPRPFSQLFLSKLSPPLVKLPACGR